MLTCAAPSIYVVKLAVFYILGGVVVATATSRLPTFWHVAQWSNQPIAYQKAMLRTVQLETIGVAGSRGAAGRQVQVDDQRHPVLGGLRAAI